MFFEEKEVAQLTSAQIEGYVDSDIQVIYDETIFDINEYLKESMCFSAKHKNYSF